MLYLRFNFYVYVVFRKNTSHPKNVMNTLAPPAQLLYPG